MADISAGPRVPWQERTGFSQVITVDAVAFHVQVHSYGEGETITLATVRSDGGLLMASIPVKRDANAIDALEAAGILKRCGACRQLTAMWHYDEGFRGCHSCSAFAMLQSAHRARDREEITA